MQKLIISFLAGIALLLSNALSSDYRTLDQVDRKLHLSSSFSENTSVVEQSK
ncbi:hypothetical protein ACFSR5_00600 [Sphingobacterium suaedae]|uniref:Uncharacterized protein n=1 Tax=Sphingobacterium suaedae TaxID=1686402 RepID=A0ABW5KB59_9SPHI